MQQAHTLQILLCVGIFRWVVHFFKNFNYLFLRFKISLFFLLLFYLKRFCHCFYCNYYFIANVILSSLGIWVQKKREIKPMENEPRCKTGSWNLSFPAPPKKNLNNCKKIRSETCLYISKCVFRSWSLDSRTSCRSGNHSNDLLTQKSSRYDSPGILPFVDLLGNLFLTHGLCNNLMNDCLITCRYEWHRIYHLL